MKGFKCDKCDQWIEGEPDGETGGLLLTPEIYSVHIHADVRLSDDTNHSDLCEDCLVLCICAYLAKREASNV